MLAGEIPVFHDQTNEYLRNPINIYGEIPITLWLFNSLPWKNPPFWSSVNHLFRLGPSKNHGYV